MSIFEKIKKIFRRKIYGNILQNESSDKEEPRLDNALGENDYIKKEIVDEKFLYGYILKTLKSIEDTLKRIEYNMITKEWALLNLTEKKYLSDFLNKLEERLEDIKLIAPTALSASSRSSSRINEIVKKATEIIKNKKEISYDDLAKELGISSSYLRSIVSLIEMNNKEIRRIIKDKKGFFIYEDKNNENLNTSSSA